MGTAERNCFGSEFLYFGQDVFGNGSKIEAVPFDKRYERGIRVDRGSARNVLFYSPLYCTPRLSPALL